MIGAAARGAFALGAAALVATVALADSRTLELPEAATTSAGVFDSSGALVRTLWSGRKLQPGPVAIEWDGRTDDGDRAEASGAPFIARMLTHNVRYVWEGVVGNTSRDLTGSTMHRAFNPINDMTIDAAGNAFYVVGYNEQQHAIHRFQLADVQRQTGLAHDDYRRVFRYAATDDELVYVANIGVPATAGSFYREPKSFVIALRVNDGTEFRFPAGATEMPDRPGNRWQSVIDRDSEDMLIGGRFRRAPTGLAVQRQGNTLFVAHAPMNEIRLFDKRAGTLTETLTVDTPGEMDVGPDDSLWVICRVEGRPALVQYRHGNDGWTVETRITAGLVAPVAIGVSPVDGKVVIADAGTHQVKAFAPDGSVAWTLGLAGGYAANGPAVTPEKFSLAPGPAYIAFQKDGSYWFGDPGNARNLHFVGRTYKEQIAFLPHTYIAAVDMRSPTRVFAGFLEFRVDYSKPPREGWTLVRNWSGGLDHRYFGGFDGLRAVTTLDNGRTYGVLARSDIRNSEIVELTPRGIRPIGATLEPSTRLQADGSLRTHVLRGTQLAVYSRELEVRLDGGNPQWRPPREIARIASVRPRDPHWHDVPMVSGVNEPSYPITSSGVVVSFNPGTSEGFHLGGMRPGRDRWLWRASPSGTWQVDAHGNVLTLDGTYELGRSVNYPANVALAAGRNILYGYHGEGWNNGQANQWMHFYDNGLFIGQFGQPVYPGRNRVDALAGAAGNAFSPQIVDVHGQMFLWHNDESVHGGLHRWRIDGAEGVKVLETPIDLPSSAARRQR